jgi:predicted NUDIX family NTP pyrophosphohydrolase
VAKSRKTGEISAGILLFRRTGSGPEVLLIHPGGPYWARKDDGAWSIPKGLCEPGEDPLATARREFAEETGGMPPAGDLLPLGGFRQPSGKTVIAFAAEGAFDLATFRSNLFAMEWPPRSGRIQEFPEADKAGWFDTEEAFQKIVKGQTPILAAFRDLLASQSG